MINIYEIKINTQITNNENLLKELFNELNCVIFLVDLISEESYENFLNLITTLKYSNIIKDDSNYLTMLLVLNKSDLNEERKISAEKIKEFKESNPLFETIEISLKTQNNIQELLSKISNGFFKKENKIFLSDSIKEYEKQYTDDFIESSNLEPEGTISCILIGDSETGKSSFLIRYFKNEFSYTFLTTIGTDKEVKMIKINDKLYKFVLWDTAGQERFRSIPGKYFQNAHGIFLLFDVNNRDTFNDVEKYDKKLVLNNNKEMKVVLWDTAGQERFKSIALGALRTAHGIILVFDVTKESSFENVNTWLEKIKEISANPCIVLFGNKADSPKEQWQVNLEEVKKFAESNKMKFFLTSAKTKEGLDDGLLHISNEAYANALKKINGNIQIDNNDEYEYVTGCFGKKKLKKLKKLLRKSLKSH